MSKKILFLLGSANLSGGTYVILQHAAYLQQIGYDVTVALVFMQYDEYNAVKNSDQCWHPAIQQLKFTTIDQIKDDYFDVAIFTWWATVFSFEKIKAATYIYFVQSIESRFYKHTETFMRDLVNRTYQLGFPVITEAKWIQQTLEKNYASICELARNGILKSIYTADGEKIAEKSSHQLRVLVEGPLEAEFKNVKKTIELCLQANVGEVWLLTSSKIDNYPDVTRVFSQVPISEVAKIYRSCDVLVKLSYVEGMFGPPLEIFHCGGTAIVYDVTGHDEYIVHEHNALVVKTNEEKMVINHLQQLHTDRTLLARLIKGAQETANAWINWETASQTFVQALEKLSAPLADQQKLLMQNNIQKYLRENLPAIVTNNDTNSEFQLTAHPLHHSGYYGLAIPLAKGKSQIGILFGKNYQHFMISKLTFQNVESPSGQIQCSLSQDQMRTISSYTFECLSDQASFIVTVEIPLSVNSLPHLYLEFRPITLWQASTVPIGLPA